jgi:hypothetical protein
VPVCDGCGTPVDEAHIRERIERLELATRFRPIHINILLIDAAPPLRRADFFYEVVEAHGNRSVAGQVYFNELASLAGATPGAAPQASVLAEFQRLGFFLAFAVECAVENPLDLIGRICRSAPTVVRRVQTSYKPKYVALISEPTRELIGPLEQAGWSGRLILDRGLPFEVPRTAHSEDQTRSLADELRAAIPAAAAVR